MSKEAEQNDRIREWFKKVTGLDSDMLRDHMNEIESKLKAVDKKQIYNDGYKSGYSDCEDKHELQQSDQQNKEFREELRQEKLSKRETLLDFETWSSSLIAPDKQTFETIDEYLESLNK